jgi:hypothetical protein
VAIDAPAQPIPDADVFQAVANREVYFGLGLPVQLQLIRENAGFRSDPVNRDRRRRLGNFDITGDTGKNVG